jgi:hypothetical protein
MSAATKLSGPAHRLLLALLPPDWSDRAGLLEAADRLDREHGDAGLDVLLAAWTCWRATDALPAGALGDVVRGLVVALGNVGAELRARPRDSLPSRSRPVPTIGFRREAKQSGEPHLVATLLEDITLPAGSRLVLRRLHQGHGLPSPEFALVCLPLAKPLTKEQRARAAEDRLDGSAIRNDPRDTEAMP